ncbi:circularly permuted type 2 ATP-grasp protein [Nocardioides marmoribigeumensis]|uniref:Circularly permuted ATP-grasp superfamily protein/putative alpha-E superfamily protein n=1 Tax=Nocardioides marmoribigeumensis TaxID=433649 RepID=A0ABU2BUC3_9ACTN|nr:circularly permuted type 2 ATP-grasp protein [Nocardioides marmoribigeumensis]MDR7362225.1 putative circularly permuted ATP-grasp superfamily protein/putative alpha-E superfamily protein [Nocardioides marmoribigeumensis]
MPPLVTAYRDRLPGTPAGWDELVGPDGSSRPGWDALALDSWDPTGLRSVRGQAARLLEDDGVTYHAPPGQDGASTASGWRLDPLPTVVPAEDWEAVSRGVAQRALLLDRVLEDLYGPRRLLTSGLVPPEVVWRHGLFQRATWGAHPAGRRRVVLAAIDLGRDGSGEWRATADRVQAPSGLGYAMENRRVVSRLLPEAHRRAELHRLTPFFSQLREALVDLAPVGVEDPRVVVLTPGSLSETAFDQAYIATVLGLPLVTGSDLVMREGRVWTREAGDHLDRRPVDVLLRRVDTAWCDPLELRPDSELGVPGLLEAARRGHLVSANAFGAGLVESPAFHALLPDLSRALLDEPLLLPSAEAWWCGDPDGLAHVTAHLEHLVVRPLDPRAGRGIHGPGLSTRQRDGLRARIEADPGGWVGQRVLPLSTTPTVGGAGLEARPLTVRAFAVARGPSYAVMPGALGRVVPHAYDADTGRRDHVQLSKDVWVLRGEPAATPTPPEPEVPVARPSAVPMVPRALENLYWLGRYTERAESTTRLALTLRALAADFPFARRDPARGAVDVLARALTHTTGTYPGLAAGEQLRDAVIDQELWQLLVDADRPGSVAQSLAGVAAAAGSVRDQLSMDVFTVLGSLERARSGLAALDPGDGPAHLLETGAQVLSGTLALTGIFAENMVRDVGWTLLDVGRGLERALQTATAVRWVVGETHPPAVERHLVLALLSSGESVVTHRRRYGARAGVDSMLDLLLLDRTNPRSVAFQLARLQARAATLPGTDRAERLRQVVADAETDLAARGPGALAAATPRVGGPGLPDGELFTEHREELVALAERTQRRLRELSDAVEVGFFSHPLAPRPLGQELAVPRLVVEQSPEAVG